MQISAIAEHLLAVLAAVAKSACASGLVAAELTHAAPTSEGSVAADPLAAGPPAVAKSACASGLVAAGSTANSKLSAGLREATWRWTKTNSGRTYKRLLMTPRTMRGARSK